MSLKKRQAKFALNVKLSKLYELLLPFFQDYREQTFGTLGWPTENQIKSFIDHGPMTGGDNRPSSVVLAKQFTEHRLALRNSLLKLEERHQLAIMIVWMTDYRTDVDRARAIGCQRNQLNAILDRAYEQWVYQLEKDGVDLLHRRYKKSA